MGGDRRKCPWYGRGKTSMAIGVSWMTSPLMTIASIFMRPELCWHRWKVVVGSSISQVWAEEDWGFEKRALRFFFRDFELYLL
jgi:hypothetical protein